MNPLPPALAILCCSPTHRSSAPQSLPSVSFTTRKSSSATRMCRAFIARVWLRDRATQLALWYSQSTYRFFRRVVVVACPRRPASTFLEPISLRFVRGLSLHALALRGLPRESYKEIRDAMSESKGDPSRECDRMGQDHTGKMCSA